VLGGIDQVRRTERRSPCRPRIVTVALAIAERKRGSGNAADDQDDRRRAELGSIHPAPELYIVQFAAFDLD